MATVKRRPSKPLASCLPSLATAIRDTLKELLDSDSLENLSRTEIQHAMQGIDGIEIVSRCNCGDDFCASFYTAGGGDRKLHGQRTVEIKTDQGIVAVDIVEGSIRHVEVLYAPAVKAALDELFP